MVKINKKKFREALLDSGGVKTTIANRLNVTRKAVYDYIKRNPKLKKELIQEEEKILDMAEVSLFSQVKNKDFGATKYILSTKGKRRGYIERQEIEQTGAPAVFNLIEKSIEEIKDEKFSN